MDASTVERDDKVALVMAMGGWTRAQALTAQALDENGGNVNRAMSQVYRNNIVRHGKCELLHWHRTGDVDDDSTTQPPPVTNAKKWQEPDTVHDTGSNKNASVGAAGYGPPQSAQKVPGPYSSRSPVATPEAASNSAEDTTSVGSIGHSQSNQSGHKHSTIQSPDMTAAGAMATPRDVSNSNSNRRSTVIYPGAVAVRGTDTSASDSASKFTTTAPASLVRPHSIYPLTARLVEDEDVEALHEQVRQKDEQLQRIRTEQENAAVQLERIMAERDHAGVTVDEEAQEERAAGESTHKQTCGSRMKWILVVTVIMAIVGAVAGAVLGLVVLKPKPTDSPLADPSLIAQLSNVSFDGGDALQTPFTPQNKALNWLSGNSNLDLFPPEKMIQRYVLATFYYSTNGARWTQSDGWLSDEDECTWYSLANKAFCSRGAVARLVFYDKDSESGNNLVGSIPAEIALLSSSLERLDFGNNTLTGSIPTETGLLTALRENLGLERNSLTGSIPSEIGLLSALLSLDLHSNSLAGPIPFKSFGPMTSLTGLYLGSNKLTGTILSQIGLLTSLEELTLHRNRLSGTIPSEIGLISTIGSYLNLDNNVLTGTIPSEIGRLTELEGLWLYDNSLTGTIPTEIHSMTSLKYLRLYHNDLSGEFTCPSFIDHECLISCKDDSKDDCQSL